MSYAMEICRCGSNDLALGFDEHGGYIWCKSCGRIGPEIALNPDSGISFIADEAMQAWNEERLADMNEVIAGG